MSLNQRRKISSSYSKLAEIFRRWRIPEREKRQIEDLCDTLDGYLDQNQIDAVRSAYEVGAIAHEGQRRLEGEKYINHPLAVARLLADLHLDSRTIIAAILHDTIEDTELTYQSLVDRFGQEVADLVAGVTKVSNVEFESLEHAEAENLRRMFHAMSNDIRVIFIKLADRMHNLESLHVHRLEKRKRIVLQTQEIYIPIASLLGMKKWQSEMEDLCFKAIYPHRYEVIQKAIKTEFKGKIEDKIKQHVATIKKMLDQNNIDAYVTGRFKNVAAIHEKMRRRGNSLKAVQDMFAFRVVVKSVDECYRALGVVHQRFKPIFKEFNDYIAIPKINGYRSLHTTVHVEFGSTIEVQIRTEKMHRLAETGFATHLAYNSRGEVNEFVRMPVFEWFNELIHTLEENEPPGEIIENLKLTLFSDDVYVFTPKNEIKRLKKGATVIDFAYAIHSEVGNRAKSATVNNERVPFHTVLENGDRVEIKTSRLANTDPAWVEFAATSRARIGIRNSIKIRTNKEMQKMGARLLKNELKQRKIRYSQVTEEKKKQILDILNAPSWSQLLIEICLGNRQPGIVAMQLFPQSVESELAKDQDSVVSIHGTEGLAVQYAKCCNPIPFEPIIGFLGQRGVVVHTEDCQYFRHSKTDPNNRVRFRWIKKPQGLFRASFRADALHKTGSLASISRQIADADGNIIRSDIVSQNKENATIEFDVEVKDSKQLDKIMRNVKRERSVLGLTRIKPV